MKYLALLASTATAASALPERVCGSSGCVADITVTANVNVFNTTVNETVVETQEVAWYDSDGPEYNCEYYARNENACQDYGDGYENFGYTANEACCACKNKVIAEDYVPPTCQDKTQPSGSNWFDVDGATYDCAWYAQGTNCAQHGDNYENFGMTANEACCACNGGLYTEGSPRESKSTLPVAPPAAAGKWDLMKSVNEAAHNTAFQSGGSEADLVLRRGQGFVVTGPTATAVFQLQSWYRGYVELFNIDSSQVADTHTVNLPVELPVGRFSLLADGEAVGTIVVLFNPWAPTDIVYMADAEDRAGYVQKQTLRYYAGNVYQYPNSLAIGGSEWQVNTAQILDDVLDLLAYTETDWEECGSERSEMDFADPIIVARAMSYMGASGADHGVVQGRWDGVYDDGKQPGFWSGTKQLMDQWKLNGHKPIKYGQCWVFGNSLTSFMRSLGIPARVISNFNSAHDVPQGFLETAYGMEPNFDWLIEEETADSVWNFHVWVNVWFTRPDLDAKNIGLVPHTPGWNDVDSTPQEASDSKYQMGPANHDDMKANYAKGNMYDNRFVMGEYNANHSRLGDEYIGRYCLTELLNAPPTCPSGYHRILSPTDQILTACTNDITTETKPTEPSSPPIDTLSFPFATLDLRRRSASGHGFHDKEAYYAHDYHMHLSSDYQPMVGENIQVVINSHREDVDMRKVKVDVRLESISYTGASLGVVSTRHELQSADDASKLIVTFPHSEYREAIKKSLDFRASAVVKDADSNKLDDQTFKFDLDAPVPTVTVGDKNVVTVAYTNPTIDALKNVVFTINGPDGISHEFDPVELAAGATKAVTTEVACGRDGTQDHVVVGVTAETIMLPNAKANARLVC